jgi:hypothetical protein
VRDHPIEEENHEGVRSSWGEGSVVTAAQKVARSGDGSATGVDERPRGKRGGGARAASEENEGMGGDGARFKPGTVSWGMGRRGGAMRQAR